MSEAEITKKVKKSGRWISILLWVAILILVLLIVFFSLFSLARTVGSSMENTLQEGQHTLLLRNRRARNGEIIVYTSGVNPATGRPRHIIKRVIASGGDRFVFAECTTSPYGHRYIFIYNSGEFWRLHEYYLCEDNKDFSLGRFRSYLFSAPDISTASSLKYADVPEGSIISVPENHFFVLGDNRDTSRDSRTDNFIERSQIVGRVRVVVTQESFFERILLVFFGRGLDDAA